MSVDIWRTFSVSTIRDTTGIKTHRKYSLYAWGSSAVISLIALIVDLSTDDGVVKPSFGKNQLCWFGKPGGLGIFLTLPMFVLIVANVFFFINTVQKIWQTRRQGVSYIRDKARAELIQTSSRYSNEVTSSIKSQKMPAVVTGRKDQARCYLYLKLFTIMGLTWIFGFIAALAKVSILWYPFIIFNGLQGAFIFVMFDVKRNIAYMLWDKFISKHGYEPPGMYMKLRSLNSRNL
ncbi:hypothetical protein C0J52_03710 [Blattella germanica]|nr:hypothetical protein C0J52_03710 [Blattella germanica]